MVARGGNPQRGHPQENKHQKKGHPQRGTLQATKQHPAFSDDFSSGDGNGRYPTQVQILAATTSERYRIGLIGNTRRGTPQVQG